MTPAQEQILRRRAEESGRYADLLYFHAVCGEWSAFEQLEPLLGVDDRLAWGVLRSARDPDARDVNALAERVTPAAGPWLACAVARRLLALGDAAGAATLCKRLREEGSRDVTLANLLARHFAAAGRTPDALGAAEASLAISPHQPDMEILREELSRGKTDWTPPSLELLPSPGQVALCVLCDGEGLDALPHAVEAALGQSHPLNAVHVAVYGNHEGAVAACRPLGVEVIRVADEAGRAGAINAFFRACDAPFMGFVDGQAALAPRYVQHVLLEVESNTPGTAGWGGRLVEPPAETVPGRWRAEHLQQDPGPLRIHAPAWLHENNGVYRASALRGILPLPESGDGARVCEVLAARLQQEGHSLTYTPHARALHLRRDTAASVLETKWAWCRGMRAERGDYAGARALLESLPGLLGTSVALLNKDIARRNHALLYLDLLSFFSDACRDVNLLVDRGLMGAPEARYVQEALLRAAAYLDDRFGGELGARIRADLTPLLREEPAAPGPHEEPLRILLTRLHQAMNSLDERTYRVICGELPQPTRE